jgi:hypothetical protein
VIPNTVVFFTDGVPTFDRLVHRGSPGVLPAEPAPPGPGWPSSTGSSFSQVAFNRANYYATRWRSGSETKLIGVGIGAGISASSNWMANPQAGYHMEYQRLDGVTYQEREFWTYQERDHWDEEYWDGNSWENTTKSTYHANNLVPDQSDGWRRDDPQDSWVNFSKTLYHRNNTTPDSTDGVRRFSPSGNWIDITQTQYVRNNVTSDESDGVRMSGSGTWVAITQAEYDANNTTSGEGDGYRSVKAYAEPYTGFDAAVTESTPNKTILARLIAGSDNGVEGIWSDAQQQYVNAAEANLYISPDWSRFTKALEAVALGECGGTLTIQTKLGGSAAVDPFTYQNSGVQDPDGNPLVIPPTVVTTNLVDKARTFDFDISDGTYRTVEVRPVDFSDLTNYSGGSWSCKAGISSREIETFPIEGSPWSGFRVRVAANEAVSCIHSVTAS